MSEFSPKLREAVNVPDFMERERLVARRLELRAEVQLDLNTIEHWNRLHPDEPLDANVHHAMLDYLDGKGPMPELAPQREDQGNG